ncbi:MAG: DUF6624 domain-containing protein [Phycisphaerales bacterium JB040]
MAKSGTLLGVVGAGALLCLAGCQRSATFEAEAALRPGAVYTGPAVATFHIPVDRLTIGQIARELTAMADANRAFAGVTSLHPTSTQTDQLHAVDRTHARRLGEIMDVIGWPTERVVGAEASAAAFQIAKASSDDPEFQRRCLSLMHDRLASRQVDPERVALLTDRVRIQAGQGQWYGTHVRVHRNEHGTLIATETAPIDDPASLDKRRDELGLDPWRHYCRKVADTAARASMPTLGGKPR